MQKKHKKLIKKSKFYLFSFGKRALLSIIIFELSFGSFVLGLASQENRFRDLWQKGTDGRMERQFEQANTASTEEDFNRLVGRGLGVIRTEWESKAETELERELNLFSDPEERKNERAKLELEKAQAKAEWENEVQAEIDARKGFWKVYLQSDSFNRVWELVDRTTLIVGMSQAEQLARDGVDAADKVRIYDETMNAISGTVQSNWESTLDQILLDSKNNTTFSSDIERLAFEKELVKLREYYIADYEFEESSLLSTKRMYFVSQQNQAEDMSQKIGQETNPSELAKLLVERTKQQIAQNGGVFVYGENQIPSQIALNFQNGDDAYQEKVLKALEEGQGLWQKAIDDMILGKLRYDRDVEMQWRSGESDWTKAYAELVKAKDDWLKVVQSQIQEGLKNWETSETNMAANKAKATEELNRTLSTNRTNWESHVKGITDILVVGADTLSTIASNKNWFREALNRANAPNSGYTDAVRIEYQQQFNYWNGLETRYRNLVAASQNQIHDRDIRGTGVGEGLLYNAGGSDPYVLSVQEFELKLAREELKLLQEKRDRAKAVYDYALGNVAQKTEAQIAAELETVRTNFRNRESAYLSLLSQLNGGGSSVFSTVGLDETSSNQTNSTDPNSNTLLSQLDAEAKVLEEKRKQLEIARSEMDSARIAYDSALKIQVLIQNPGMLGQIGDLTTDSNKIQGNSGLRGEILSAQEELDKQREVLRQQEKKMYELMYEKENALRSQTFYAEINRRVLEFEKIKENRLTVRNVLNGEGSLDEKIDTLLAGDTLVQLYGNEVSTQVRANLESWKNSLVGINEPIANAIDFHNNTVESLLAKLELVNPSTLDSAAASINGFANQYQSIVNRLYSDSRLDPNYLNAESILPAMESLAEMGSVSEDYANLGKEGISELKTSIQNYLAFKNANVGNEGTQEYAEELVILERAISSAVYKIDQYNQFVNQTYQMSQFLSVNVLDALSKTDALIDATLTASDRSNAKTYFSELRGSENTLTTNLNTSLQSFGSQLADLNSSISTYGQANVNFKNSLETKQQKTATVSSGLLSLFEGYELEYKSREVELKFLLDANGDEAKLNSLKTEAERIEKTAGAAVNLRAMELLLGYLSDLPEEKRNIEGIYLTILKDAENNNHNTDTDANSVTDRRAYKVVLEYVRSGKGFLASYLQSTQYTNFIEDLERQRVYADELLAHYEAGNVFSESEREEIRWNGDQTEKKLLSDSIDFGNTFFFKSALAQIAIESATKNKVTDFVKQVESGAVLSVLKEEYFKRQENKATGLVSELYNAVSALDGITASKLYSDSFVIGGTQDRDTSEETRLKNILDGYLAEAPEGVKEKLTSLLNFDRLIQVFGLNEASRIYSEINTKLGMMQSSYESLLTAAGTLLPSFESVESQYPNYFAFFSDANKTKFSSEITKLQSFLDLKDFEDTSKPLFDTDTFEFLGYEKPFETLNYEELSEKQTSLDALIQDWDRIKSELETANTEYINALTQFKASVSGTEENAQLANLVAEKLAVLSEKQAQATDFNQELTTQIDEANEVSKSLLEEYKSSLSITGTLVTFASLLKMRDTLPGLAAHFDSPEGRVNFHYTPLDGTLAQSANVLDKIADLEIENLIQKTNIYTSIQELPQMYQFSEKVYAGMSVAVQYQTLYARRNESEEEADDLLNSLGDRITVFATQENMNTISQEKLIEMTTQIRSFLLSKSEKGEEINQAVWDALSNVDAFTNEMANLKYYQSLSATEKTNTSQLKSEYEEAKSINSSLEEVARNLNEMKGLITSLEQSGQPLDSAIPELQNLLKNYEALKTKLNGTDYAVSSDLDLGIESLQSFVWENHKTKVTEAYLNTISNNGSITKFIADIKSGNFVLPGPDGKISQKADFLGQSLTESQLSEIENFLKSYDLQFRLTQTNNLSTLDSTLQNLDPDLQNLAKELSLREGFNRIQNTLAEGMIPNLELFPSELKTYVLTTAFEDFLTRNSGSSIDVIANEFSSYLRLNDTDRNELLTYISDRLSKNPSSYLPDSLKEYHLLDTYYQNYTGDLDPDDVTRLTSWLNTHGYDQGMFASLQRAARKDMLVRSFSGENFEEYITSANNKLSSPVSEEEKQAILLSKEGLYDPTEKYGTNPLFVLKANSYLRAYSFKTGFSDLAESMGEESKQLTSKLALTKADEQNKKFAYGVSNKTIKIESYISYIEIRPEGQATPSEETQIFNRLRELEYQAEHRLGNFLALISEYNSYAFDPGKEDANPSLKVLLRDIKNSGYTVRDEVYSKNENLEYEFFGGFDNARQVTENYLKNNLPGRFAIEDPYAIVNQSKGSMSSSAGSIIVAGEEIGVIHNIKQASNGNYLQELEKYRSAYNLKLSAFETAETSFKNSQSAIETIQNNYNSMQEQVVAAYNLMEAAAKEMNLLSAVYDFATLEDYSNHQSISGEIITSISSPLDMIKSRYENAEKEVTAKLQEITALQKKADDRMRLNELQNDQAVQANKNETREWAERAMRFSEAEQIIQSEMQRLQAEINSTQAQLSSQMLNVIAGNAEPGILAGRLDYNSSFYLAKESHLRHFYTIADGVSNGQIGAWDFIHGSRSFQVGADPYYSAALNSVHPGIKLNGYYSNYARGQGGRYASAAQQAFDGVFLFGNAGYESGAARLTSGDYNSFAASMDGRLSNSMAATAIIVAIMQWGNPLIGLEAIKRNDAWIKAKGELEVAVAGARSTTNQLKTLQAQLNRYTDISTQEQLRDVLKGGGSTGLIATGLTDADLAFLTGPGGQLSNGTLEWTGGKEKLSIDRMVGKNGDPLVQKRAIKDSFGLFIRKDTPPAGVASSSTNVGYSSDGRLVNMMTSADEFMGSLASLAKTQYEIEREEYYAAQEAALIRGVKADRKEILDDRESFFSTLLTDITQNQGRKIEFDMYKVIVEDYLGEGKVVDELYSIKESQERDYQMKVWETKEKDFQTKKSEWMQNVEYLMNAGVSRFNDMLSSFNQSWDTWRRDFRKESEDGKAAHMKRIEDALKQKAEWEINLLNQANRNEGFQVNEIYAEIQKSIASLGNAPTAFALQNNANTILNNILASKPQTLDTKMVEQGLFVDVQFFVDSLSKAKYDDSNIKQMKALTTEMDERSKQMAVLQTLDSLWSIPLTFEETIKEQNKELDKQLSDQLMQDGFFKMGGGYVRSAVDKMGNPTYQILPTYSPYDYKKPERLPTVKDSQGKEWDLTDFTSLQGKNGPTSAELTTMVRLAKNQLETDFKATYDPEKSENREIAVTLMDPKAMSRVMKSAQSSLQQLYTDPQKAMEFGKADEAGRQAMIESAKNSGYLVGPTVGGSFGAHHFSQFYPILKLKEFYNEQKAEGEALKGDGFANAVGSGLSLMTGGLINAKQATKFMHDNGDMIDTITTVAAVIAAPFTGGASLLALAAYKSVKGAYEGGILGAATGAISAYASVTGVDVSYSYDEGFGANIGIEAGALSMGVSYSETAGFGVNASMEIGMFSVGASYSQNEGFGASLGISAGGNADGTGTSFSAGLNYSQRGGLGGNVGVSNNGGLGDGVTSGGMLSYNKQSGFGANASASYKDPSKAKKAKNTQNSNLESTVQRQSRMSGTGVGVGYTQKGGFEASLDIKGANAFNWNETDGLTGNSNFAVDKYRADERDKIEKKKEVKEKLREEGEEKFVDDWKKKHPKDADLSNSEILAKYAKEKRASGASKDGSRIGVLDHVQGFVEDNILNYGGSNNESYVDEKGEFHVRTCFVAGTKVHTKEGLKNIEDIQVGDVVLSWNEDIRKLEYNQVLETYIRRTKRIFKLTYENGQVVETTDTHPFYVERTENGVIKKDWVVAESLKVGDKSILSNQQLLSVYSIDTYDREETVYNLQIAKAHTYFVTQDNILVHNGVYENANLDGPAAWFTDKVIIPGAQGIANLIGKAVDGTVNFAKAALDNTVSTAKYVTGFSEGGYWERSRNESTYGLNVSDQELPKALEKLKKEWKNKTCFVAGTLILNQKGWEHIENIQIGDVVKSWNEEKNSFEFKEVYQLFEHEVSSLYNLETSDGEVILVTWNHPFWVVNKKSWVETRDLDVGDELLTGSGENVYITNLTLKAVEPTKVYNFEVRDNHSYLVGEKGIVVHNYKIDSIITPSDASTHEKLVVAAAVDFNGSGLTKEKLTPAEIKAMKEGVVEPDTPAGQAAFVGVFILKKIGLGILVKETDTYKSHFGEDQWKHSMSHKKETNQQAVTRITGGLEGEWKRMKEAKTPKEQARIMGNILHTVTDAYATGHMARNAKVEIIQVQDYNVQDHDKHGGPDKYPPKASGISAEEAALEMIRLWKSGASFDGKDGVKDFLTKTVYKMEEGAKTKMTGASCRNTKIQCKGSLPKNEAVDRLAPNWGR